MSETSQVEAEAIRRRYVAVFGGSLAAARDYPLATLRELLKAADAQREEYLAMGFEVDDGDEASARGR